MYIVNTAKLPQKGILYWQKKKKSILQRNCCLHFAKNVILQCCIYVCYVSIETSYVLTYLMLAQFSDPVSCYFIQ